MPSREPEDWTELTRDAFARYSEPLLRIVAGKLIKPRVNQPIDELIEKSVLALANPPIIDRRIKDLPPASRKLLALIGISRQPRWKVGQLISFLSAIGHAEGFGPIEAALESGLIFPDFGLRLAPLADFPSWLGQSGTLSAVIFAHPSVAARARGESFELAPLAAVDAPFATARLADGLEWPLRLAAAWQQVHAQPVRLTQVNTLFKRDLTRLQTDDILAAPAADQFGTIPDPGVLVLFWAASAQLLAEIEGELRAAGFPAAWEAGLFPVLTQLFAALPRLEAWDPLVGYAPIESGLSQFPTVAMLCLLFLAAAGSTSNDWYNPVEIANRIWDMHPSWAGTLPKDAVKDHGAGWVTAFLFGVAYPLRLVESIPGDMGPVVRLTDFGKHLFNGAPEPIAPHAFPQTLLVQPNAEILAYRQGLTPSLIGTLTRFAKWKGIGPACTLELNPEQTYRGLESGLTLPHIHQTLARHGTRPVPPGVIDLLRRWADKRDRITMFTSAVLVEFPTSADLDEALSRGIVSVRLTSRIGITADGTEPALSQLRLIGNRDYEAKSQKCITVASDGVTLTIDTASADLLLEAEIARLADPDPADTSAVRRFVLTPQSMRRAMEQGLSLHDIDVWFHERTGDMLTAAGRLFLQGPQQAQPTCAQLLVVRFATSALTDGIMQWPATSILVQARLGPMVVTIDRADLESFRYVLGGVAIELMMLPEEV